MNGKWMFLEIATDHNILNKNWILIVSIHLFELVFHTDYKDNKLYYSYEFCSWERMFWKWRNVLKLWNWHFLELSDNTKLVDSQDNLFQVISFQVQWQIFCDPIVEVTFFFDNEHVSEYEIQHIICNFKLESSRFSS